MALLRVSSFEQSAAMGSRFETEKATRRRDNDMVQHILIDKAKSYPTPRPVLAENSSTYDIGRGYWQLNSTMEPMVTSDVAIRPATKKFDRETGEDMKGE